MLNFSQFSCSWQILFLIVVLCDKLMKAVEFRIADRQVLHLIRLWVTALIIEKDEQGRTTKKQPGKGTPQGRVASPLLLTLKNNTCWEFC